MGSLATIFGAVVTLLAAAAVVGALVFTVVWEVCAIKRTLAAYRAARAASRTQLTDDDFWRQQRALNGPQ
jgi:hypothetical protein